MKGLFYDKDEKFLGIRDLKSGQESLKFIQLPESAFKPSRYDSDRTQPGILFVLQFKFVGLGPFNERLFQEVDRDGK